MNKKLNLKNDIIFKTFFSKKGNEKYLIEFLNAILKTEIKSIKIREEVSLEKLAIGEKGGRLDLQAELDNEKIVNIEMQIRNEKNIEKRTMIYAAKTISRETKKGTKYDKTKQVIMINILDYEFLKFDEYISETVTVLDKHREYEIIKDIKWYFIELPKFRKAKPDMNKKLNQWLAFIDDKDRGLIEMAEKKNKTLEKAREEINYLTGDEEVQRLAELREKWEMDYNSGISYATQKGMEEGLRQGIKEGIKKGIKEGIERGIREGLEQGEKNKAIETAKKMIHKNMPIQLIIDITGLTEQEVINL